MKILSNLLIAILITSFLFLLIFGLFEVFDWWVRLSIVLLGEGMSGLAMAFGPILLVCLGLVYCTIEEGKR